METSRKGRHLSESYSRSSLLNTNKTYFLMVLHVIEGSLIYVEIGVGRV
jgi:hypothetical protein